MMVAVVTFWMGGMLVGDAGERLEEEIGGFV